MLELGSKFLLSYFLGSIMGAMVVGRLRGGVDIRTMGSGNAGGTNALRTQGWLFALGVVVIDVGKGALAAGLVPAIDLPVFEGTAPDALVVYSCAAAAVIGHVWPLYHRFRGGKGAATAVGTLAVLAPVLLLPTIVVWLLLVTLVGYVGLATMTAAVALAAWVGVAGLPGAMPLFLYTLFCALYMIYTHHSNIERMLNGEEPKNAQFMLFGGRGSG